MHSKQEMSLKKTGRKIERNANLILYFNRAKTGTEFWNRLSDLWKPNRNRLIVILSLIVGRSKLVQRTSEDDLSTPINGLRPDHFECVIRNLLTYCQLGER